MQLLAAVAAVLAVRLVAGLASVQEATTPTITTPSTTIPTITTPTITTPSTTIPTITIPSTTTPITTKQNTATPTTTQSTITTPTTTLSATTTLTTTTPDAATSPNACAGAAAKTLSPSTAQCGISNSLRIVGGSSSSACEYPWMVLLYDRSHNTTCGGAIIDHIHVLTAAHCVAFNDDRTHQLTLTSPSDLTVHSGTSVMNMDTGLAGSVTRLVASVVTHHGYSPTAIDNDIALLTLTRPIEFDRCHKPVCLVDGSKTPQMASECRVIGWGRNSSSGPRQNILMWVDIPVVSDDVCRAAQGKFYTGNNFCAGAAGVDSCGGDSGGPLVCQEFDGRFYSYGIVSSGSVECGTSYGLYTKVSRYIAWIEGNQRKWYNGQP